MQAILDFPGSKRGRVSTEVLGGYAPGHSKRRPYSISFFRKLYDHIKRTIVSALGLEPTDWERLGVEFQLTSPDVIDKGAAEWLYEYKNLLRKAGIGTGGLRHCAVIGPAETEAAATAVLQVLPAARSSPGNLMIKIGTTHVTILLARRSSREAPNSFTSRVVYVPKLNCHIEDTVSQWLEESHPDVWQGLGEGGLGHVVREGDYRHVAMVLRGGCPRHKPCRLAFQGLPRSFTHHASGIRNGLIEINRSVPLGECGFPSAGLLLTLCPGNIWSV